MKYNSKIILFFIFCFCNIHFSYTQNNNQNTKNDTSLNRVIDIKDSILNEENILLLPINEFEIPANELYKIWRNDHVSIGKSPIKDKTDTTSIPLTSHGNFVFPFKGKLISTFGYRENRIHQGCDIKLNKGDTVLCAFDGVVRMAKRYSNYGKIVVVRHYNGLETVYSHLSLILVNINQKIKAGDIVGLGGRTGRATTEHLHFETRYLGEPFNPLHILDFANFSLFYDTLIITRNTFKMRSQPFHIKGKPADTYIDDSPEMDSVDVQYALSKLYQKKTSISDSVKISSKLKKSIAKSAFFIVIQKDTNYVIEPKKHTKSVVSSIFKKDKKNNVDKEKINIYIVKKGDTLFSIARNNNVSLDELCKINNISKEDKLSLGQKIKIPKGK